MNFWLVLAWCGKCWKLYLFLLMTTMYVCTKKKTNLSKIPPPVEVLTLSLRHCTNVLSKLWRDARSPVVVLWHKYETVETWKTFTYLATNLTMIRDDTDKLLILLSFGLIIYVYFKTHKSSLLPLPPGPRKLPLLANLLDLPTTHQWLKFIEWGKEFSMFLVVHLPSSSTWSDLNG